MKLSDQHAHRLLSRFSIPTATQRLARTEQQAVAAAQQIGFPVAMKISSPQIIHKTDAGGVLTGLGSGKAVREGFRRIIKNAKRKQPKARIDGVLVQKMVTGHELIVGSRRDPQFGPVLMFGLGGIFVEVLQDVTFRLIPISRTDAQEMVREIKAIKILEGVRGQKPVNFAALERLLLNVSRMVGKTPKIRELDLNPVFADEKGVTVIDARMII